MKRKSLLLLLVMTALMLLIASPAMAVSWNDGTERYYESVTKEQYGGVWSYDADTKTLTLNNINISSNRSYVLQLTSHVDTVVLIGENRIVTTGGQPITLWNKKTVFTGTGSLYAKGNAYGILASNGNSITFDGVTIHAVSAIDSAIRAYDGVIDITGGAKITTESVANIRAGSVITGPNGKVLLRNGSSLDASLILGNMMYDDSTEYYPIHRETPLTIEDTSSMTLNSVKPFNYTGDTRLAADSLSFTFPGGATNYMTCTKGSSHCAYNFLVSETELSNGQYQLNVKGSALPANQVSHNWSDWLSNGDGTHTRTCSENSSHTQTKACTGGKATATKPAICSVCGSEYGEVNPNIPNTGDSANLALWFALAAIGTVGMIALCRKQTV